MMRSRILRVIMLFSLGVLPFLLLGIKDILSGKAPLLRFTQGKTLNLDTAPPVSLTSKTLEQLKHDLEFSKTQIVILYAPKTSGTRGYSLMSHLAGLDGKEAPAADGIPLSSIATTGKLRILTAHYFDQSKIISLLKSVGDGVTLLLPMRDIQSHIFSSYETEFRQVCNAEKKSQLTKQLEFELSNLRTRLNLARMRAEEAAERSATGNSTLSRASEINETVNNETLEIQAVLNLIIR